MLEKRGPLGVNHSTGVIDNRRLLTKGRKQLSEQLRKIVQDENTPTEITFP